MPDRVLSPFMQGLFSAHPPRFASTVGFRTGVFVALAYYLACLTGFLFRFPSSDLAYISPPTAVLLASLLLVRRGAWPTMLGAAFLAHVAAHVREDVPALVWGSQFLANGVQAVVAALIVFRFCGTPFRCDTLRGVSAFVAGAAVAAPALASLLPTYVDLRMDGANGFWSAWGMRTLTNVVTTVTLVPPLIAIFGADRRLLTRATLTQTVEFILLLLASIAVLVAALTFLPATPVGFPLALYACVPFLAWAAVRFGFSGLSIALLAVASMSFDALSRHAPGAGAPPADMIVGIQLFVVIWVMPLMLLSAVREEGRHARRTEQALYHSEAKNAAILRAIPDLMFVQTKDSEYRYLDYYAGNRSELLVDPDQFLGKRMRDVLPPDLARSFERLFQQTLESGEPRVMEYSLPIQGTVRVYEARVVPCQDDRLLSIVRDITEAKHAEAALQQAHHELERISRASALGELAASIAHEVQQPLCAISANAAACERLLDHDVPDSRQIREALGDIVDDAMRASHVIVRTRALFSGGRRENAPVDLNSAIREVLAMTRNRAERGADSVRTDLNDGALIVMGDRIQLQQVLLNLVVNGLEAMRHVTREHRELLVRSWRSERLAHVAVRDTGQGFDPADLERIFDPFYTTKSEGLGMGLAISRSIVLAHHGTLRATLNIGGGATFEFAIPAALQQG